MPDSVNDRLLERQIAHGVGMNRFAGGLSRDVVDLIDETTAELKRRLARRLDLIASTGRDIGPATTERLRRLINDLRQLRRQAYKSALTHAATELKDYARLERDFQLDLLRATIPAQISLDTVTLERLASIVASHPFTAGNGAAPLADWFADLEARELTAIERQIRSGLVSGQGIREIVRSVVGAPGVPSVLQSQRHQIETVVRSAVLHVGNTAREALFAANTDVIQAVQWVATLDIRICPLCWARDGFLYDPVTYEPLNGGPPYLAGPGRLHPRCRCGPSPVVKSAADLGIEAREGVEGARASMDGQVPAKLSARQWIDRASKDPDLFRRAEVVLGRTRADLLRRGLLKPEQLLDFSRGELWTLKELQLRNAALIRLDIPGGLARTGLESIEIKGAVSEIKKTAVARIDTWAKKLGITSLPTKVQVDEGFFLASGKSAAVASYDAVGNRLLINSGSPYWRRPTAVAAQMRASGRWSSDHPAHVLFHELGHFEHAKVGGLALTQRAFTLAERRLIASEVSSYAATEMNELVAEVYAGVRSGRTFSDKIMDLFREAGGVLP